MSWLYSRLEEQSVLIIVYPPPPKKKPQKNKWTRARVDYFSRWVLTILLGTLSSFGVYCKESEWWITAAKRELGRKVLCTLEYKQQRRRQQQSWETKWKTFPWETSSEIWFTSPLYPFAAQKWRDKKPIHKWKWSSQLWSLSSYK